MGNFEYYNSEKRFIGRMAVGGVGTILGRISFFDEEYTEGSILCISDSDIIDRTTLLLCPPIAVVVVCCESGASIGALCTLGVPCIVLDSDKSFNKNCKNKVALVDIERGILTVNPSIDTLNFYSAEKNKRKAYTLPCEQGCILRSCDEGAHKLDFEHFLVSSELICKGGSFFDSASALWENGCPELLIVDMRVPTDNEGEGRKFSERVEELFCAALYGSFALSLSDFYCEEEISFAIKLLHKSFCLLEAEGREFNGYIPRGLVFSSPLWLMRASPVTNPDFIILDFDKLLPALFCLSCEEILKREKLLKKELFSVLERYITNFMPRCELFAKTEAFFGTRLLHELVKFLNIKLVFR